MTEATDFALRKALEAIEKFFLAAAELAVNANKVVEAQKDDDK